MGRVIYKKITKQSKKGNTGIETGIEWNLINEKCNPSIEGIEGNLIAFDANEPQPNPKLKPVVGGENPGKGAITDNGKGNGKFP